MATYKIRCRQCVTDRKSAFLLYYRIRYNLSVFLFCLFIFIFSLSHYCQRAYHQNYHYRPFFPLDLYLLRYFSNLCSLPICWLFCFTVIFFLFVCVCGGGVLFCWSFLARDALDRKLLNKPKQRVSCEKTFLLRHSHTY